MHTIVNRQSEIVSLIIAPAACLLILTAPIIIEILFTKEFYPILPLMRWMGLGIMLRALHVPMAYITFAKGNKKVFFYLEGLFGNILTFLLSCIGFYFFGLIGLGYAFVADNAICIIVYYCVNRNLYSFHFTHASIVNMMCAIFFTLICFSASLINQIILSYACMSVAFLVSLIWGGLNLRRKIKTSDDLELD